jgi:hypothetical protein
MIMETAEMVVEASLQAEAKGSVNEAVLEILFADSIEPTSAPTREAYARRFNVTLGEPASNGHAEQPAAVSDQASHDAPGAPAQASAFGPAAAQRGRPQRRQQPGEQPTSPAAGDDISDVFPDYDDYKAADIKKAILFSCADGSMSPEEWERIKAYEVAHEDRKTIRELQPEFKAPEPEPQPEVTPTSALARPTDAVRPPTSPPKPDDVSLEQVYAGQVQTRAQQEGLPIPHDANPNVAPLPVDITNLTDQQLSRSAPSTTRSSRARSGWSARRRGAPRPPSTSSARPSATPSCAPTSCTSSRSPRRSAPSPRRWRPRASRPRRTPSSTTPCARGARAGCATASRCAS